MRPCEAREKGWKFTQQVAERMLERDPRLVGHLVYEKYQQGADIRFTEDAPYRLAVENKFRKNTKIHEWMRQAETYRDDGIPVVMFKSSQSGKPKAEHKILVTLDLNDFLELMKK
jgi:hypothetical protein